MGSINLAAAGPRGRLACSNRKLVSLSFTVNGPRYNQLKLLGLDVVVNAFIAYTPNFSMFLPGQLCEHFSRKISYVRYFQVTSLKYTHEKTELVKRSLATRF